ncbi:hypothetical protein GUJ93_ZPchr0008g12760 [Zizania palustris]|uniref:Uncharacterized protein n=1 Tax=Zizania palustris TaxID=103762 RepID=A0A8J5RKA4_ZIZPA|nr:hypothetical protein GUJ93_ZPchr0008g12760 [Zizania palustris]
MRKAGAKEDFERSVGTDGAVDVKRSPVSSAVTGRRSGFMIRLCTCPGRSSLSSLCNLNNSGVSMTCKGCGGESSVDRGGPSCSSKLNTMSLELPRPIDPEVRWKTVNRRQRASRRARTSFSGEDIMKDAIRSFYAFGNDTSQELSQEDAPVSESEKLGVSILGRRFSDPVEKVPIKKRRFLMDSSPSPPPTPLLTDPYEKLLSRSFGVISSHGKHHKAKTLGLDYMEEKKEPFDADDFSGISILAAAACESEIDDGILNVKCSKLAHCIEERKPELITRSSGFNLLNETKEEMISSLDASNFRSDRPLESSESAPDTKCVYSTTLNSENLVEPADAPYYALSRASKMDDSSSASDAKSSGVTMSINSSNPDKSVGCLQDVVMETKCSDGTQDSRLHWDLNVAMEAWDTNCGDDDDHGNKNPVAFAIISCDDAENAMNKPQACQAPFHSIVDGNIRGLLEDKIPVIDTPKDAHTKGESYFTGNSSSQPCSLSPQIVQMLESKPLEGSDSSAETKDLPGCSYVCKGESHLGPDPACNSLAPMTEQFALTANEEKLNVSHASALDYVCLSQMASIGNLGGINSVQMSELGSRVKPFASRLVSEESTNLATLTVFNKSSTDLGCSTNKLGQASQQSISEFKNQDLLDVDSGTSKIDLSANDKVEHDPDVLTVSKRAADADNHLDLPDFHMNDNPGSSDCYMAHAHEEDGANATISKIRACANSSNAVTYHITDDACQASLTNSECTKPIITDMDSVVDSQSAEQSYLVKAVSDNFMEHCIETKSFHINKDLARTGNIGAEEDDSQYEDGELRESGEYWGDDCYGEVKHDNYQVLDYKEAEGTPCISPPHVGSMSKNMGDLVADYNGTCSRKEDDHVSPASLNHSWSTNSIDDGSGSGMMCAGSTGEKALSVHFRGNGESQIFEMNPGCVIAGSVAAVSQSERVSDGLGDDLSSIRTTVDSRDTVDSSNRCILSTLDAAGGGESLRHMESSNGDMQPRVDQSRLFDKPHRTELCRSDDGYSLGSKAERTIDIQRSHERGGAPWHIQGSSQVEQWVENSNSSHSTRHKSPDYYNYGPPGPRNATEAAIAKMQSNGFVVAPDGTLVKAVDTTNAGKTARKVRNTLNSSYDSLSGRGSPIDRDRGCRVSRGPAHAREASPERRFGASGYRSVRYDLDMDKDLTNVNSSSVCCSLSNRQRGFPPHRASLNLSRAHSRSPSGSRSRSPHAWASPRNRREIMGNGNSSSWRHSRSLPICMTEVRMGRITSPSRQSGFGDRVMRYSPSSRDHAYSQHASTWVDGKNCSTVDLPDHKKQRYSRRSPPLRVTSRNDRFDVMDSHGRPRSRELYRPTQGRVPYGFERGRRKHDGNDDDQRDHADRYEIHSIKPYDRNDGTKQSRNNTGDKLRPHISAPRSPDSQRRGIPRRFDRVFERQLHDKVWNSGLAQVRGTR